MAASLGYQQAQALPTYTLETIGLYDQEHTRDDGYQYNSNAYFNNAGQAIGYARRYDGAENLGTSTWLYNGTSTVKIGLYDSVHTSDDGVQNSQGFFTRINNAGQAIGDARRYVSTVNSDSSAWFYNGTNTVEIGLIDSAHTRDDGLRTNNVYQLNDVGQVIGHAGRFNGSDSQGTSAWLYNGTSTVEIGLIDSIHTGSDGSYINVERGLSSSGHVVGLAVRNDISGGGRSVWLYNGISTSNIGLTDGEHTRNDGRQYNTNGGGINNSGQVIGTASRYNNGSAGLGTSVWFYNGTSTTKLGLSDSVHTRNDGLQFSLSAKLNDAGQVAGNSRRYNGSANFGQTAWLYSGTSTIEIGLTDSAHTRNDGFQQNDVRQLNDAGQAGGNANRYNGSTALGTSAWFYDGTSTFEIGLTDSAHTRTNGYQNNTANRINNVGQVTGYGERFDGNSSRGRSAWLYDETTDMTYFNDFSIRDSDGYAFSDVRFLSDDIMLGYYRLYDESNSNSLGDRAFGFTIEDGFFDLEQAIVGDLATYNWEALALTYSANSNGQILGTGQLIGQPSGSQAVFILTETSPVPVPAAVWLMGSALIGLFGFGRKKKLM